MRPLKLVSCVLLVFAAACAQAPADEAANNPDYQDLRSPTVQLAERHATTPPLALIPIPANADTNPEHEVKAIPRPAATRNLTLRDPVLQSTAVTLLAPTVNTSFPGVGQGFSGPNGTFTVSGAPPDTNGDVGPNHYVQTVNQDLMIWDKAGNKLHGPLPINSLFQSLGGLCAADNDGDPIVLYDQAANRWFISQFAVTNPNPNYHQCIAVSQTADPTGAYYTYDFAYTDFNDYGKAGVWNDAYYFAYNMFAGGSTFSGAKICAFDRTKMLSGQAATQQCFNTTTSYGGLLPADIDGATTPAAGEPEFVIGMGTTATTLAFWKFHVDWTTPANSTFSGPTTITVPSYAEACSGGTCIPQTGTTQQLDSLADRMMYRLQWRKTSDGVEHLVTNHSVTAGSSTGVRWYEIRSPNATPTLYQSGTYAPDANYRWMGSAAMDGSGGIALGFSKSSSTTHPAIAVTGRNAADAAGTMGQGETTVLTGGGSQTTTLSRWGDYSNISVDPSDDCTFWFTTEFIPANGTFNWQTQVASFKLSGCGATATNDFSISASPASVSIAQGASGTSTISTTTTSGTAQSVSLSASGLPAGATASFSPASVTSGSSSTMTITVGSTTTAGTYTVTVTGTGTSATHTTTVTLTVTTSGGGGGTGVTNGGFETGTLSGWTATGPASVATGGHGGTYAALVGSTSPSTDASIAQTFTAPTGATSLTFWYKVVCPDSVTYDWATATLKDNTSATTVTMLAKTCTNSGAWVQASASVTAGHSYTLTLANHDDNYAGDATYTYYDDVAFTTSTPVTNPFTNPGFEAGSLSGWTASGITSVTTAPHSGTYAAQLGSTSPSTDSSIAQTVTIPSGATKLTFWYKVTCPDTVTYDWATATLKDNTTATTTTVLAKTCTNNGTWAQVTATVTAGHSVTLTLSNHDDNYAGDATYTQYDDVNVQ